MSIDLTKALARSTDPLESHVAAKRVAVQLIETRTLEVLNIFGPLNGNALNKQYARYAEDSEWAECHLDSPRKRLARMYARGWVKAHIVKGEARRWSITVVGMDVLGARVQGNQ